MKKAMVVVMAIFAALVAVIAPTSAASAAVPTQIDIGYAVEQGGWAKASGSYSNGSGEITSVCVSIRYKGYIQNKLVSGTWSEACRSPQAGWQEAFSAPDYTCPTTDYGWNFQGVIMAWRSNGSLYGEKWSNTACC